MANGSALPPLPPTGDDALRSYMQTFVRDWLAKYVRNELQIYSGDGVPTLEAPEGALYQRLDTGKLYVRESAAWVAK